MATNYSSNGHQWVEREIKLEDSKFFHRRCVKCHRDLVRTAATGWRAVHVGGLRFDFLSAQTTACWVSELCPDVELPEEANARRLING